MRKLFAGYYRPTKKEFDRMWREGVFVFDANILLNIYRGSLRFSVLGCPVTGQEDPQAKVGIIAEAEGPPFH